MKQNLIRELNSIDKTTLIIGKQKGHLFGVLFVFSFVIYTYFIGHF